MIPGPCTPPRPLGYRDRCVDTAGERVKNIARGVDPSSPLTERNPPSRAAAAPLMAPGRRWRREKIGLANQGKQAHWNQAIRRGEVVGGALAGGRDPGESERAACAPLRHVTVVR